MKCKKCDFQNEEEAKFCKSCGEVLEEANNTASDNTKNKPKRTNPVIIVAIVAVIIIVVVGGILISIRPKTLKCTIKQEQSGMKMKGEFTAKFIGEKANKANFNMSVDLSEQKQYKDILYKAFKKQLDSSIKEVKDNGGKASMSLNGNVIEVKVSAEVSKMSGILSVDEDNNYDTMKKSLEKAGYSCN